MLSRAGRISCVSRFADAHCRLGRSQCRRLMSALAIVEDRRSSFISVVGDARAHSLASTRVRSLLLLVCFATITRLLVDSTWVPMVTVRFAAMAAAQLVGGIVVRAVAER